MSCDCDCDCDCDCGGLALLQKKYASGFSSKGNGLGCAEPLWWSMNVAYGHGHVLCSALVQQRTVPCNLNTHPDTRRLCRVGVSLPPPPR